MQQGQETFTCNACGYQFAGRRVQLAQQPTCPNCRAFCHIVGADGASVTARSQQPARRAPARSPYARAARGSPVARRSRDDNYVEVNADVAYGKRNNTKALINGIILVVMGIGMVTTLYFIVTSLQSDQSEKNRIEREVVLDEHAFEQAIDAKVETAQSILNRVEGAGIQQSTNFADPVSAIAKADGDTPTWSAPPQPGTPFRVHGFVATHDYRGAKVKGFVMLLYYRTAEEVAAAQSELIRYIMPEMTNFGVKVDASLWYVAYMGVSHGGPLRDALKQVMDQSAPSSFKQFTDRVGGTVRDELKD